MMPPSDRITTINTRVFRVAQLTIYPIKSLGGVNQTEWLAQKAGFALDRRWMLIDKENHFLTQRNWAGMALFNLNILSNEIQVNHALSSAVFHIKEEVGPVIVAKIWDDAAFTREVNPIISEWFSDHLHQSVRLVKLTHEEARKHPSSVLQSEVPVSLADSYPYLLTGTKSLENLNDQLSQKIAMNRFRPNIVVTTIQAHEEDQWQNFSIGEAAFRYVKPCGRCNVITIDQETGLTDNEPLKILNKYRKQEQSVCFGSHLVCLKEGLVKTGDALLF